MINPLKTQPSASTVQVGAWNLEAAVDIRKLTAFNRQPIEVTKEHLRELYALLYPFIVAEFSHREDVQAYMQSILGEVTKNFTSHTTELNNALTELSGKLTALITEYKLHVHAGSGAVPPVSGAVLPIVVPPTLIPWVVLPEAMPARIGEAKVVPGNPVIPTLTKRAMPPLPSAASIAIVNILPELNIVQQLLSAFFIVPFDGAGGDIQAGDTFGSGGISV